VEKDTKRLIVVIAAALLIIVAAFVCINMASGVNPPQTVVESESMQHGVGSQIGVIDTGDMVLLKNKDKVTIRSYVDGYKTGYQAFGGYGDVIVYGRDNDESGRELNPVIHRAILWLDYNGDRTWSAPSLDGYPLDRWSCVKSNGARVEDVNKLSGNLTLKYMGYREDKVAVVNLDRLVDLRSGSGFITMGDNNSGCDQPVGIAGVKGLITYEQIRSVAWMEIPWVGAFKMLLGGKDIDLKEKVPNTVPCLAASIMSIVFLLFGLSFLFDKLYYIRYRKELYREMNAPTPIFPVEEEYR